MECSYLSQMLTPLSERYELLAKEIVDAAFKVHKSVGPGLLESVYQKCFMFELENRGINYVKQKEVPIVYNSIVIDDGLILDLLIEDVVIVELKAQENFHPVWIAQLLSYMRLSERRLGFLINFHVPMIKDGIYRRIL
jgi:GxxExxY protein